MHVQVEIKRLEFADFRFDGLGPKGPCAVGIERKKIRDVLCSIEDGRFAAHQLPGLIEAYDYVYLIVEGRRTVDTTTLDLIEPYGDTGRGRPYRLGPSRNILYRQFDNYLNSISTQSSCRVKHSLSPAETIMQLVDLYNWWQKPWSQHQSLKVLRKEPPKFSFFTPSVRQLVASCLPGIGYEKSMAVAQKFPTITEMVLASPREWASIPGIGKILATRITKLLFEGEEKKD
jgi:ERCC4-type nuclease